MRWLLRQLFAALAVRVRTAISAAAPPVIFAAVWTMLYPAWRSLANGWLPHAVPDHWLALSWPYPSLLELACGMVPAVTFIWIGFLAFIVARRDILESISPQRFLASLSASLNVLLLSTLGLLQQHFHHQLLSVTREDFYSTVHLYSVSIPLTLSIFLGIWMVLPHRDRPPRVRRRAPDPVVPARWWRERMGFHKAIHCGPATPA